MYEQFVLGDERYVKKGQFMKQSSWYSILNLIDKYDRVWTAHRFLADEFAKKLGKNKAALGSIARELLSEDIVPAGPSDSGAIVGKLGDKESYLAQLRKLRKKAGNAVLLVPMFMSDRNLVNARIMLLVGRPPPPCLVPRIEAEPEFLCVASLERTTLGWETPTNNTLKASALSRTIQAWSEQTWLSVDKITPEQDLKLSVHLAGSMGENMVRQIWVHTVSNPEELARVVM